MVVVMAAMGAATVGSVKVGVSWALAARVVAKASKGGGRASGSGDLGGLLHKEVERRAQRLGDRRAA